MLKVLIADDEVKVSQLILHLIHWEDFGMEVIGTVTDGQKALEQICKERPDVVITDIRMPSVNGIELVERSINEVKDIFFIIVSGYSQFEYAQQAVKLGVEDYLLKPIKKKELEAVLTKIVNKKKQSISITEKQVDLENRLQLTKEKIKNNILIDLYKGGLQGADKEEVCENYGCNLAGEYFTHLIFHLYFKMVQDHKDEYYFSLPKIQKNIMDRLTPVCEEVITRIQDEEILCLVNTTQASQEELLRQLNKLKTDVSNSTEIFPNLKCKVGVGKTVNNLKEYKESIQSAENALHYRFAKDKFIILGSECTSDSLDVGEIITGQIRKNLLNSIELVNVEAFSQEYEKVIRSLKPLISDGELVHQCYKELANIFLFGISGYCDMGHSLSYNQLLEGICYFQGFQETFSWLEETCVQYMIQYEQEQEALEMKPIRQAKQYIIENYNKSISLEQVSNVVGFNPAYFSSMFKKYTGQNFMDYVIEVRISNAKNLLIQTDQDLTDIAMEVGYTDLKYFSKLFKKITSLSPSEFRKLYG